MGPLQITGIAICAVSAVVIWSVMSAIGRANIRQRAMGVKEQIPWRPAMKLVVLGSHVAFACGLALIFAH